MDLSGYFDLGPAQDGRGCEEEEKVKGDHKSYVIPTINSVNQLLESHEPTMANQLKRP